MPHIIHPAAISIAETIATANAPRASALATSPPSLNPPSAIIAMSSPGLCSASLIALTAAEIMAIVGNPRF